LQLLLALQLLALGRLALLALLLGLLFAPQQVGLLELGSSARRVDLVRLYSLLLLLLLLALLLFELLPLLQLLVLL